MLSCRDSMAGPTEALEEKIIDVDVWHVWVLPRLSGVMGHSGAGMGWRFDRV